MLEAGKLYLFPSTLPFIIKQNADSRLEHLYYNFIMDTSIVALEPIEFSLEDHPLFPPLLELMEASVTEYRRGDSQNEELKGTVISLLESFLSLALSIKPHENSLDREILDAIEYIELHYAEDISVEGLAERAYLSTDHFIRRFKQAVGITPYSYVRNLRMSVVSELLQSGASLTEASGAVGFKHPSSCCRALHSKKK
jgi:transcriptional regulator GlxA family with amidase domain